MLENVRTVLDRFNEKKEELERKVTHPREHKIKLAGKKVFAQGFGFYKLFWIFVIASIVGAFIETIFCWAVDGQLMSRSSLVFGQFSVVWGIGGVFLTYSLHWFIDKSDRFILIAGTVLGGLFEYICSVFTEVVFGVVFWDYSNIPFNIDGRVNLLYSFFWGIASLIWIKICYPWISHWIEKLPIITGRVITWILVVFFTVNISVTTVALYQMNNRSKDIEATTWIGKYVEKTFSDEWLENRYRNLMHTQD
ncbi:MAG: putative ABC transporter permease [Lachnospiraceae bacterium]